MWIHAGLVVAAAVLVFSYAPCLIVSEGYIFLCRPSLLDLKIFLIPLPQDSLSSEGKDLIEMSYLQFFKKVVHNV